MIHLSSFGTGEAACFSPKLYPLVSACEQSHFQKTPLVLSLLREFTFEWLQSSSRPAGST